MFQHHENFAGKRYDKAGNAIDRGYFMPKRPRSHELEDQSRNRLHELFTNRGWTIEDLAKDYGEDLFIRIFAGGAATPLSFFVQAKATDNIAKYMNKTRTTLLYPIACDHLRHWERFWEPVILTLWDSKSGVTYWECIQTVCESLTGKPKSERFSKTLRVHIPADNTLDNEGLARIEARTRTRFEHFARERVGARELMRVLEEEFGLKLEYDPQYGVLFFPQGKFVKDPKGLMRAYLFGRAAEEYSRLAKRSGLTYEQIFHGSLTALEQVVDGFSGGGKLTVKDSQGKVVESWDTLEQLMRDIDRKAELDE
jgi:hypothetical protein